LAVQEFEQHAGAPTSVGEGFARIVEFVHDPNTRLLITLVAEAVEPDSPVRVFYADLHAALRAWTGTWTSGVVLPSGMDRDGFTIVLIGAVIGVQWRFDPDAVNLEHALATLEAMVYQRP
jgi:TetR/AcrR family acrAB operon transcriptional repressor